MDPLLGALAVLDYRSAVLCVLQRLRQDDVLVNQAALKVLLELFTQYRYFHAERRLVASRCSVSQGKRKGGVREGGEHV